MKINLIFNCVKYGGIDKLFTCEECQSGYYSNGLSCVKREYLSKNVLHYEIG